jgi:hypothetical protein
MFSPVTRKKSFDICAQELSLPLISISDVYHKIDYAQLASVLTSSLIQETWEATPLVAAAAAIPQRVSILEQQLRSGPVNITTSRQNHRDPELLCEDVQHIMNP